MKKSKCPFCGYPSLITTENQYFCFSCGMGGDRVSYLHSLKSLSYRKSAELRQVKLLPEAEREEEEREVLEALSLAEEFFFSYQSSSKSSYFKKRKLKEETVKNFRLGFSPGNKTLFNFLLKKGIKEETMMKAGLISKTENGEVYDKFWKRVMFPIRNEDGTVIGFGGRVLGDGKPKYLNSPDSVVFDKSHNLYAFDIAKHSKEDFFLLAEGYVDVISLHQIGFSNAVASLGTSFTMGQAELLSKHKKNVYIVYDSDGPGQKATAKAISLLLKEKMDVKVVSVSPYKDVDELICAEGHDAFAKRLERAEDGKKFLVKGKSVEETMKFLMTEF